jgi:Cytochrome C biogenesis protein transmembrane region
MMCDGFRRRPAFILPPRLSDLRGASRWAADGAVLRRCSGQSCALRRHVRPVRFRSGHVRCERRLAATYGEWRRLAGASLAPYYIGRLTTYTVLGAVAGMATALFASTSMFAWLSAALLAMAAFAVGRPGADRGRLGRPDPPPAPARGRPVDRPAASGCQCRVDAGLGRQSPLAQRDSSEQRSARSSRSLVTPPRTHSRNRL